MHVRCAIACAVTFLCLQSSLFASENLLSLPLQDWSRVETTGSQFRFSKVGSGGESSFDFSRTDDFSTSPLAEQPQLYHEVPVSPGELYVAEFQYKSEALDPIVRVVGRPKWSLLLEAELPAGAGWQNARLAFVPSEKTILFRMFPAGTVHEGFTSGSASFKNIVVRKASDVDRQNLRTSRVTIDPTRVAGQVDRRFFGANSLFWIDDDQALADPQYTQYLRDMGCGLLRFPGGEVADNYHWKTNLLDDRDYYPKSDGPDKTDTDEFINWCRKIGAEPIFVVNLDSHTLAGTLDKGIQDAADWVRYCNKEKGYNVRYWEIGNETYLRVTRYPLTAREYAEAVKAFSTAMKAVDPSIQVGAVGPAECRDIVPFDQMLPEYRNAARKVMPKQKRIDAVEEALAKGANPNAEEWWKTLCEVAGRHFDFAVIHQYRSAPDYSNFAVSSGQQDRKTRRLSDYLQSQLNGRSIPLALTEWNASPNTPTDAHEHGLITADLAFQYLKGGVTMANAWPLRMNAPKTPRPDYRAMLIANPLTPRPAYTLFRQISGAIGEELIAAESNNAACSVLASRHKQSGDLTVMLINKEQSATSSTVEIKLDATRYKVADAAALQVLDKSADEPTSGPVSIKVVSGGFHFQMPAGSLATIRFVDAVIN